MMYLDTNVFLLAVLFGDAKAVACREVLRRVASGETVALTSVLAWDEFVYVLRKLQGRETAVAQGRRLLRYPNLRLVPADLATIAKAQSLVEATHLKPRDAIHAATAMVHRATEFLSDDSDFDGIEGIVRIPLSPRSS